MQATHLLGSPTIQPLNLRPQNRIGSAGDDYQSQLFELSRPARHIARMRWRVPPICASPRHRVGAPVANPRSKFSLLVRRFGLILPALRLATRCRTKQAPRPLTRFRMIGLRFRYPSCKLVRPRYPRIFILSENDCDRRRDCDENKADSMHGLFERGR